MSVERDPGEGYHIEETVQGIEVDPATQWAVAIGRLHEGVMYLEAQPSLQALAQVADDLRAAAILLGHDPEDVANERAHTYARRGLRERLRERRDGAGA